jgi:hypothetical protein
VMMLTLAGTFFVLPLYLQIVLGKDPIETGVEILPMSAAVFIFSLTGSRLSARIPPRRIVRVGLTTITIGALLLLATIDSTLEEAKFLISLAIFGTGFGLVASQLGNVNLSSVPGSQSSEAGGLQGTAQNLGSALGTALIGSILLTSLTGAFDRNIDSNPNLTPQVRREISAHTSGGLQFVPASAAEQVLRQNGVPEAETKDIVDDYSDAEIRALKTAVGGIALAGLLGLGATRRLPKQPLGAGGGAQAAAA